MECTHLWDELGICRWCKINIRFEVARLSQALEALLKIDKHQDSYSIVLQMEDIAREALGKKVKDMTGQRKEVK